MKLNRHSYSWMIREEVRLFSVNKIGLGLGEGYTGLNEYYSTEGIVYTVQHYDGDGYQALLYIKKDDETIVNSAIDIHIPEPFDDYFRTILRSYDGKGMESNPDYKGDERAKEMNNILLEINSHFQN